jgi:hypothetical protein
MIGISSPGQKEGSSGIFCITRPFLANMYPICNSLFGNVCTRIYIYEQRLDLKNYIIRIYRLENNNPKKIIGVVEEPEIKGKKAFTNLDELWGILNPVKAAGE